ncbi:MAG: hypothetical protein LC732_00200, partial [Acidobacteria bacterium]|nr:hypothetical protein [Acidobacteriota bacterium]
MAFLPHIARSQVGTACRERAYGRAADRPIVIHVIPLLLMNQPDVLQDVIPSVARDLGGRGARDATTWIGGRPRFAAEREWRF